MKPARFWQPIYSDRRYFNLFTFDNHSEFTRTLITWRLTFKRKHIYAWCEPKSRHSCFLIIKDHHGKRMTNWREGEWDQLNGRIIWGPDKRTCIDWRIRDSSALGIHQRLILRRVSDFYCELSQSLWGQI